MTKAYFLRKEANMRDLYEDTQHLKMMQEKPEAYTITKEIQLTDAEFQNFKNDLLEDQTWISEGDGGMNKAGEFRCIRVTNKDNKNDWAIIVNSEGYNYPRYTAIDER